MSVKDVSFEDMITLQFKFREVIDKTISEHDFGLSRMEMKFFGFFSYRHKAGQSMSVKDMKDEFLHAHESPNECNRRDIKAAMIKMKRWEVMISKVITALVHKELIEKIKDEIDKRSITISLTKKGIETNKKFLKLAEKNWKEILNDTEN